MEVEELGVTDEHRLRRLLFTATSSSSLRLQGGYKKKSGCRYDLNQASIGGINKNEINKLTSLLQPPPGMGAGFTNLALQHCLAAMQTNIADRRALFLVLSAILKTDCKQTKTQVYQAISKLISTPEDLFEFFYYHRKIFDRKPWGMGSGMRRMLKNWYLSQDPYDLALDVSRVVSRHNWTHADIIKLARPVARDAALDAVLFSLVHPWRKVQNRYEGNREAQPVLEYLACVRELNTCASPDRAVQLIERHSFDTECVPTHLRGHLPVFEAALVRMPLRGVLTQLRVMTSLNFLTADNNPILVKLQTILEDPVALRASQLQPAEILGVLVQAECGWALPAQSRPQGPEIAHREKEKKRVPSQKPHVSVIQSLKSMLNSSLPLVSKAPMSMVVCVDTRNSLQDCCYGAWTLSISRALSTLLLSLLHAETDLRLVYMTPEVTPVPLNKSETVEAVQTRLEALPQNNSMDPVAVLRWVRASLGSVDLVLVATHSRDQLADSAGLGAAMEQFRQDGSNLKLVYWALHSKKLEPGKIAGEDNPNILDLSGWCPDVKRIIQAFGLNYF